MAGPAHNEISSKASMPSHGEGMNVQETRTQVVSDLLTRAHRLVPYGEGLRTVFPTAVMPGNNRRLAEVVVTQAPGWANGEEVLHTNLQILQRDADADGNPRGGSTRIAQITGQIIENPDPDEGIQIKGVRLVHPKIDTQATTSARDDAWNRVLVEAGSTFDAVERDMQRTERQGIRGVRQEATPWEQGLEQEYQDMDDYLQKITFEAPKENGETPRLKAFKDWCNLNEAEAEVAHLELQIKRADSAHSLILQGKLVPVRDRLDAMKKVVDDTLSRVARFDNPLRTIYPFTYKTEFDYWSSISRGYAEIEMQTLLNTEYSGSKLKARAEEEHLETPGFYVAEVALEARMKVSQRLRERQEAIAAADPPSSEQSTQ